jgi:hypothetical protein
MTLTSVITTRLGVIYTCRVRFSHEEYECNTHECNYNTHKIDFYTHRTIFTCKVWFYTQSLISTHVSVILTSVRVHMILMRVITTRSSVIYACRVRWPHEECDLNTHSLISTCSVISTGTNVITTHTSANSTRIRLIFTRREWFLHAESDFIRSVWFPPTRE